jgi:hypothetical protein
VSRCCREALDAVLRICHRIVVTPALREEWKKHGSRYFWKWWSAMAARRKVVKSEGGGVGPPDLAGLCVRDQAILTKDLCLVEAAYAGDGVVITRDDELRKVWESWRSRFRPSRDIVWLNPVRAGGAECVEKL